jgi:hypothetical protein
VRATAFAVAAARRRDGARGRRVFAPMRFSRCFFRVAAFVARIASNSDTVVRRRRAVAAVPALELFPAKLLTSRNHVISFRPADANCGSE